MPLTINVGLSRKSSENYQSEGASINLTAELDQSLLREPDQLQQEIDRLYQQADQALQRQAKPQSPNSNSRSQQNSRRRQNGHRQNHHPSQSNGNANAHRNGNRSNNGSGPMTQSQRRAIDAITRRLDIDASDECHHEFGWSLNELTVREASALIDHLKELQTTQSKE